MSNFCLLQSLHSTPCVSCEKFYLEEELIFCIMPGIASAHVLQHESSTRVYLLQNFGELLLHNRECPGFVLLWLGVVLHFCIMECDYWEVLTSQLSSLARNVCSYKIVWLLECHQFCWRRVKANRLARRTILCDKVSIHIGCARS